MNQMTCSSLFANPLSENLKHAENKTLNLSVAKIQTIASKCFMTAITPIIESELKTTMTDMIKDSLEWTEEPKLQKLYLALLSSSLSTVCALPAAKCATNSKEIVE